MSCAKLLICDDHPAIRTAVMHIAKDVNKDLVVVEAGNAVEAMTLLERHSDIELVLLDLHLPGISGLDLLSELKRRYPSLPVVVLSSDESRATVIDALERGATGYICKSSPTDLLAKFLEHALEGRIALPTAIFNNSTAARTSAPAPAPHPATGQGADNLGLSPRQTQVLAYLLRGMSNKEISRELGLAEGTVKSHIVAIFRALDVNSRAQAVIEASRRGFQVGNQRNQRS